MFSLELIDDAALDANDHGHDDVYVPGNSTHVPAEYLVFLIENQESSARECFQSLSVADKKAVLNEIVIYTEKLVIGLQGMRAECIDNNLLREQNTPPVIPRQLVGL